MTFFPFIYFKGNILFHTCHGKKFIQIKFIIVHSRFRQPCLPSGWQHQGGQQHFQLQQIRPLSNWVCTLSKVLNAFRVNSKCVSHHTNSHLFRCPSSQYIWLAVTSKDMLWWWLRTIPASAAQERQEPFCGEVCRRAVVTHYCSSASISFLGEEHAAPPGHCKVIYRH